MNRHTSALSLVLAALALLGLVGPVAAGQQVPFHGSLAGVFTLTPIPDTPLATVSANLTGNATHLGRFTLALPETVDFSKTPPFATGTFIFIAANGDTVFGSFSGAPDSGAPPVIHVTEIATIEGGTGRFTDASGGFTISRSVDLDHLTSSGSFDGIISSPGR